MTLIDINELREIDRKLQGATGIDEVYTFYYDETNNIRKFHVREHGFNQTFESNFVLGGVMYEGIPIELEDLFDGLNLDKDIKEVKFRHIAYGDFATCLTSKRLNFFLQFLLNSNLYIHFSSINILYFSLVDIVDSAIVNSPILQQAGPELINYLKNDLYKLAKLEKEKVIALFWNYGYPNIKSADLEAFIDELAEIFDPYIEVAEFHISLTILKDAFISAKTKGELPFIMDEENHVLIKHFGHFYLRPIYLFKNAEHIFDKEDTIEPILDNFELRDDDQVIKPYRFEDSKNDRFLEVSDIFIGLMGKLFTFINTHSMENIINAAKELNEIQMENLSLLLQLLDKSNDKNPTLLFRVDAIEELNKLNHLFYIVRNHQAM